MSAEDTARYRRAKAIAFEVLEEPSERRAGRIDAACGDDAALRREVAWLIDAAEAMAALDDVVAARQYFEEAISISDAKEHRALAAQLRARVAELKVAP